jgi:inosine/xanthosine triphosphate pyrophosphatase family protein
MAITLLFATRNPFKRELFVPVLAAHGVRCVTLADVGLGDREIDEVGETPEENALLKARAFHSPDWPLVLGDDAGLEIDALGGEPGLKARRWNGRFPDDVDDETWMAYLLQRMEGVPLERRTARYVAAWALITPDGREHVRRIYRPFTFADRPLRPIPPGAPMSALEIRPDGPLPARERIAAEWARWGILGTIKALDKSTRSSYNRC